MVVGLAVLELHIPEAMSLKDKRRVVKSLIERLHQRLRVSVAETAFHDLHQRAEIGIAAVASAEGQASRLLEEARGLAEASNEAYVVRWDAQLIEEA
jgi:uncharacterized protein YlxP (DUF503 family)